VVALGRAIQKSSRVPVVVSHETAAAFHGLALYRPTETHVHTIVPEERPGAMRGIVRHRGAIREGELVEVHGILCTNLVRTLADICRTSPFEQAVVVADATLRRIAHTSPATYDLEAAAEVRRAARTLAALSAHGLTRAERVLRFADGRAQLPGESISRIRLASIGFSRIVLQREVPGPRGRPYYVDFSLDDVPALGEFDGSIKYVDGRMLDGRTTAEVFDREKQREDWIRGATRLPLVRWGWPHIKTADSLSGRLSAFGIHPPR